MKNNKKILQLLSIVIAVLLLMSAVMPISIVASAKNERVIELPEDDGKGYAVTGISDSFNNNETAVEVTVPDNILRLGEKAFYGCTNLKTLKLHNKIQKIGKKSIEETAYFNDKSNWVDGVLYIDDCLIKADPEAVNGKYSVQNGTRLIADGAFENCTKLTSVELPDTVQYVGADAFAGTALITNKSNWKDNSLIINNVLISVDKNCSGVFTVPDGIASIADSAFTASGITEFVASDNLRFIGNDAFSGCQKLKTIHLGKTVETLGYAPFKDCLELSSIEVSKDNKYFSVVGGVLYDKELTSVVKCPSKFSERIDLPVTVKRVEPYAFFECEISMIRLSDVCVFIGDSAFKDCDNLSYILLPEKLEYIEDSAFENSALESIIIPDKVNYIGNNAFSSCKKLQRVVMGGGVDTLNEGVFNSTTSLTDVSMAKGVRVIKENVFSGSKFINDESNYQDGMLIISDYYLIKTNDISICNVPESVRVIADGAFTDNAKLKKVFISSTVYSLGKSFENAPKKVEIIYKGNHVELYYSAGFVDLDNVNLYTEDITIYAWLTVAIYALIIGIVIIAFVSDKKSPRKIFEKIIEGEEDDDYE